MKIKRSVLLAGFLFWTGSVCGAGSIVEGFDWGPSVTGRESITNGQSLKGSGVAVSGQVRQWVAQGWGSADFKAAFSGNPGIGSGSLTMSGTNSTIWFKPETDWMSGVVVATAQGTFIQGNSVAKALYFGFQSAAPDNHSLARQTTDNISVKLLDGAVVFRAIIAGETAAPASDAGIIRANGDTVSFSMAIDAANKTATLITTGAKNSSTNTLRWTTGAKPQWASLVVQELGSSTMVLDSVTVSVIPGTGRFYVVGGMGVLSVLLLCRRRKH